MATSIHGLVGQCKSWARALNVLTSSTGEATVTQEVTAKERSRGLLLVELQ